MIYLIYQCDTLMSTLYKPDACIVCSVDNLLRQCQNEKKQTSAIYIMYPISFNFEIENARCYIFLSVKMREKNAGQIAIQ